MSVSPEGTETVCTNCGTHVPSGLRFCTNCGTPVKTPIVAEQPVSELIDGREAAPALGGDEGQAQVSGVKTGSDGGAEAGGGQSDESQADGGQADDGEADKGQAEQPDNAHVLTPEAHGDTSGAHRDAPEAHGDTSEAHRDASELDPDAPDDSDTPRDSVDEGHEEADDTVGTTVADEASQTVRTVGRHASGVIEPMGSTTPSTGGQPDETGEIEPFHEPGGTYELPRPLTDDADGTIHTGHAPRRPFTRVPFSGSPYARGPVPVFTPRDSPADDQTGSMSPVIDDIADDEPEPLSIFEPEPAPLIPSLAIPEEPATEAPSTPYVDNTVEQSAQPKSPKEPKKPREPKASHNSPPLVPNEAWPTILNAVAWVLCVVLVLSGFIGMVATFANGHAITGVSEFFGASMTGGLSLGGVILGVGTFIVFACAGLLELGLVKLYISHVTAGKTPDAHADELDVLK